MNIKILVTASSIIFPVLAMAQGPAPSNFLALPSGDQEVPLRETNARGQAFFELTGEGEFLAYRLIVANIQNVVAAHIHLAPAGSNGAVVAFLFGNEPAGGGRTQGVIAEGLIGSADLVGPLAGQDLAVLVETLRTGGAYVNVHTNDGLVGVNTGPGDFASGEIRGQIRPLGPH